MPAEDLAEIVRDALDGSFRTSLRCPQRREKHGTTFVKRRFRSERVCITGSFYLAAEMRRLVLTSPAATAGSIVPHARLHLPLLANFILQVANQLGDVRVGPGQHVLRHRLATKTDPTKLQQQPPCNEYDY